MPLLNHKSLATVSPDKSPKQYLRLGSLSQWHCLRSLVIGADPPYAADVEIF